MASLTKRIADYDTVGDAHPTHMSHYLQNLFGFDGQVAVVIGGTGVLGGELCKGLAQAGASVVVAGRSVERGQACVDAIQNLGGNAMFAEVDATQRQSVAALQEKVLAEQGRVDALVNCAGVNSSTPYFEITDEEFSQIINTNLLATHLALAAGRRAIHVHVALLTRRAWRHLARRTR